VIIDGEVVEADPPRKLVHTFNMHMDPAMEEEAATRITYEIVDLGNGSCSLTPEGVPDQLSWHGMLHAVAPVTGFLALSLACFVFARRAFGLQQRGWAVTSIAVGVVIQILGAIPNLTYNFIPLWIAMALGFGWISGQLARVRAELATA
jgi:hypothetical protein